MIINIVQNTGKNRYFNYMKKYNSKFINIFYGERCTGKSYSIRTYNSIRDTTLTEVRFSDFRGLTENVIKKIAMFEDYRRTFIITVNNEIDLYNVLRILAGTINE